MKIFIIVIVIILAIAGGLFYYINQNKLKVFEPKIKEKLNELVKNASNGLYHLEIEKIETDVINSKIVLINVHLRTDTIVYEQLIRAKMAPNDVFDITISQLSIDDIAPADFITNREVNLRRLFINKPVISVRHKKQPYNLPDVEEAKSIFEKIQKDVSKVQIDTIILNDIEFLYTNTSRNNSLTRLSNVKLFFTDILIDSTTQFDKQRFLYAKNCQVNLKNYTVNTPDSLYRFKIGSIDIQTINQAMQLKKLQFTPRVPVQTFYNRIKHQQDRFEVTMDQIYFNRVNWWAILAEESFLVQRISMLKGAIRIFNDKSQPADTRRKVGRYPHQLMMKLPFN